MKVKDIQKEVHQSLLQHLYHYQKQLVTLSNEPLAKRLIQEELTQLGALFQLPKPKSAPFSKEFATLVKELEQKSAKNPNDFELDAYYQAAFLLEEYVKEREAETHGA